MRKLGNFILDLLCQNIHSFNSGPLDFSILHHDLTHKSFINWLKYCFCKPDVDGKKQK